MTKPFSPPVPLLGALRIADANTDSIGERCLEGNEK